MNVSLNWLSQYIDLEGLGTQEISDMLTFAGIEVEGIQERGVKSDLVVVAQVVSADPHPQADRLKVCQVDAGEGSLRQIVCGAQNYKVGDKVPCSLPGAQLPGGIEIKEGKLRGVESRGMLCSASELGLPDATHGLWILPEDMKIGTPVRTFVKTDTIFELEITPNRPDLLSHWGMARELAAITGRTLKADPAEEAARSIETTDAGDHIRLEAPAACPLYTAVKISGVKIGPSPEWLAERLVSIGLRPINNIVDITNYVLHEIGHPLHAFDASKISEGIAVRPAHDGEQFQALVGGTYTLTPEDLVIADHSGKALALGGVMGGAESGVTEATTDIVLESAWFQRSGIRFTSRRLALGSDSSYRFERGTSPWNVLRAAARARQLILEIAGGTAGPVRVGGQAPTLVPESAAPTATVIEQGTEAKIYYALDNVHLDWSALDRMAGGAVPHLEAAAILKRLGCNDTDGKGNWDCPPWRLDLKRDCDLLEEIIRVYGLDNIPSRYIARYSEESAVDRAHDFRMSLARRLAALGFWEAQTLKLIATESPDGTVPQLRDAQPLRPLMEGDVIRVALPLSEDHAVLRPSLAPGLVSVAVRNMNQGMTSLRFFEMGRFFRNTGGGKGKDIETDVVGIFMAGKSAPASWSNPKPGNISFEDLTAVICSLVPNAAVTLTPARPRPEAAIGADVQINGTACGYFARMNIARCRELGLPEETYYCAIELRKLQDIATAPMRVKELPQFPGSSRDAAMDVPATTTNADILKAIAGAKQPLLVSYKCFDVFADPTGVKLAADRKSMAYTFLYRAADKTLTAAEVDAAHKAVLDHLGKQIKTLQYR
ncbi:phenylalanine--tRNA ligase subunit beta [Akkermansia glycaniphila]|uniref:Phenylalanine--tRNA ligase beta subunit n=1 Tax=Akkermansia glycaniphila TaxID=1679444 RepID=A0A1C7P9I2_9BACT|nr:phenylalanine--tRNA ligase subunit beta [Akkermansia glycaniphila]OCA02220.1 phenylalanyl-tRNA synthetase subunit beta [Akkermansia glycaniphila]SEH98990.1 phet bact: phenylalanine--trna ligase beta subunit [Akkermansia glycaniphila]